MSARIASMGDTARQFVLSPRGKLTEDFPVWILRQEPRTTFSGCDCALSCEVLVVCLESAAELSRLFGIHAVTDGYPCVCRCMGSFIE